MNETKVFQNDLINATAGTPNIAKKGSLLLRLIRAAQPITRTEIANRLDIDKSTVTENVKPLIAAGILREERAISEVLSTGAPDIQRFQGQRGRSGIKLPFAVCRP